MALEDAEFIGGLSNSTPTGDSDFSLGDNEILQLKQVLKRTFPGSEGNGLTRAINCSEDDFDTLIGTHGKLDEYGWNNLSDFIDAVVDNNELVIDTLYAPQGTRLLFYQNRIQGVNGSPGVPPGWSPLTTNEDITYMVVANNEHGGEAGGEMNPIFWGHSHDIAEHALSAAEIPPHQHKIDGMTLTEPAGQKPGNYVSPTAMEVIFRWTLQETLKTHLVWYELGSASLCLQEPILLEA